MTNHAILRLSERYNKRCTSVDIKNIVRLIKENKGIVTRVNPNNSCFYLVKYMNIPIKVLYHFIDETIITVYPIDVDEVNSIEELNKCKMQ